MKEHTLTKGSVGRGILLFVLPIIVGSLIQQLYVTIDAVVVGQFTGKLGLAAIDSVHTLFKFPLNFMNGLASGATILISGHCGSGDERQMHCSIRTACTVASNSGCGLLHRRCPFDTVDVTYHVRAGGSLWQGTDLYLYLFWRYLVHGAL